jgi:predicted dehydrogenase
MPTAEEQFQFALMQMDNEEAYKAVRANFPNDRTWTAMADSQLLLLYLKDVQNPARQKAIERQIEALARHSDSTQFRLEAAIAKAYLQAHNGQRDQARQTLMNQDLFGLPHELVQGTWRRLWLGSSRLFGQTTGDDSKARLHEVIRGDQGPSTPPMAPRAATADHPIPIDTKEPQLSLERKQSPGVDRRGFLERSARHAAVGMAAGLGGWLPAAAASQEPLRVGLIGLRNRGRELAEALSDLPGVDIAALCDIDADVLDDVRKRLGDTRTPITQSADYRRLLDDSRLHAVVVATPDHSHAVIASAACLAGKDVYVESPATHTAADLDQLRSAQSRSGRVLQTGLQQRSGDYVQSAVRLIRSRELGAIRFARAWMACRRKPIGRRGDSLPPTGVDYAAWLSPAPPRPFNSNRFHGNWARFWDYGSGELGLWGIHWLDVAAWALELNGPVSASAVGSRVGAIDDQETPDTLTVHYQFHQPRSVELAWEHRTWTVHGNEGRTSGIAFYGEDGTLVLDRGGWKIYDRRDSRAENGGDLDRPHLANFIDCVRTRQQPAASLENVRVAEQLCHLGVEAYRSGQTLKCDLDTNRGDA